MSSNILIFAWACELGIKYTSGKKLELPRLSGRSPNYYNYNSGSSRLFENMIGNYPVDFNNGESANIAKTQSGKERP